MIVSSGTLGVTIATVQNPTLTRISQGESRKAILVDFSTPVWVKGAAEGGAECDRRRAACVPSGKPVFQTHLRRLSCRRLGFPTFLGSTELLKLGQGLGIELLVRITLAQGQTHPPDTDPNLPPNLQQFEANCLALRLRPLGPFKATRLNVCSRL